MLYSIRLFCGIGGECRIAFGFPGKKFIDRVHDLICYRRIFHHFKFQLRRSAQQFADFIFIFHARQLDNNAFPSLLLNGRLGNTVLVYTVADNFNGPIDSFIRFVFQILDDL